MKRLKAVFFLASCLVFISSSFCAFGEESASKKNGLDVMFVMDYSGSMASNDPDHTATGMVKAFIDTVHSGDIRIGFVAYNDRVVSSAAPVSVRTQEERDSLKTLMDTTGYSGNTDIGLGLNHAYGLTGQEDGRKCIFVLISDGETDLKASTTGRTKEISDQDLRNTVEACRSRSIPLYTVAFGNYDGSKEILKEISSQTGGQNYTVEKPETLIEVLYGIFHDNMAYRIQEITNGIYGEGIQSLNIKLEDSHLDEMDVLMISPQQIGDTTVIYGEQQINPVNLVHYSVAKLSDIKSEIREMNIRTNTKKNQELKIYLISYRDLTPVMETETSIGKNQPLSYKIYFKDKSGSVIKDEAFYKNFTPKVVIYPDGQADSGRRNMETAVKDGILTGKMVLSQSGTYYIDACLEDGMESCVFHTARIQVINTPPTGELPKNITYNLFTGQKQLALKDYFSDSDGDAIFYTMDQEAGDVAKVGLEAGILTIKPLKPGRQNLILNISDGDAVISCSYPIEVVPLWKAYGWVMILILAATGGVLWRIFHKQKPELEVITETKAQNCFQGKMDAYFIKQPEEEEEIPPLTFPMYKIKDNRISLGDLMKEYSKASAALGLDHIFLIADEDRRMILYHSSDSSLMIGNSIVCRKIQYSVSFGDIISITSLDGAYDLEIHYISMIQ